MPTILEILQINSIRACDAKNVNIGYGATSEFHGLSQLFLGQTIRVTLCIV